MAVKLGVVNVERVILKGLTAKQFRRWEHYAELEPFDEVRDDYRAASVVAAIFNANRGKGQKALTLEEGRVKFGEQERKPPQTPEQQLALLKILAAAHANDDGTTPVRGGPDPDAALTAEMRAQVERARAAMKKVDS